MAQLVKLELGLTVPSLLILIQSGGRGMNGIGDHEPVGRPMVSGAETDDPQTLHLREAYLTYLQGLENPDDLGTLLHPDFWPHDLSPESPDGGRERLVKFRRAIAGAASTTETSVEWIDNQDMLTKLTGNEDLTGVVGARIQLTYRHDRGTLSLPGVSEFPPTDRDVHLDVIDVVRFSDDPDLGTVAAERWSPASPMPSVIRQLQENAAGTNPRNVASDVNRVRGRFDRARA